MVLPLFAVNHERTLVGIVEHLFHRCALQATLNTMGIAPNSNFVCVRYEKPLY